MIISKTPCRISFVGGGTDYPAWFEEYGNGAVLSTTIDKYAYISVRWLPPYHEHKYRAVWSRIENVNKVDEINHAGIRECLRFMEINDGVAINHDGDLPAASGIGTSSTFIVGLLYALHCLKNETINKTMLAREAIYVEQCLDKRNVGNQDQVAAAFGGLNVYMFDTTETCQPDPHRWPGFQIREMEISQERRQELHSYMMLLFTGMSRDSSEIASTYKLDKGLMMELHRLVFEAESRLYIGTIKEFAGIVDYGWSLKKRLSDDISTQYIEYIYDKAKKAGAMGSKLLGAGGGGFLLIFCEPEKQMAVREALKGMLFVPFNFESKGSQIVVNGLG